VAGSDAPEAPVYQLEVAKAYLELRNYRQVRTEARILLDRWPTHPLAEDAQLLTAQAWSLERHEDEALRAFQALLDSRPRGEIAARALEGQAHIHAQAGRFDRALELYALALPQHPNPEAIRTAIEAVRERRDKAAPGPPGDKAAAFDHLTTRASPRETP
jgi:tetratricopeptide (TPR) repeat protein